MLWQYQILLNQFIGSGVTDVGSSPTLSNCMSSDKLQTSLRLHNLICKTGIKKILSQRVSLMIQRANVANKVSHSAWHSKYPQMGSCYVSVSLPDGGLLNGLRHIISLLAITKELVQCWAH